MQDADVLQRVKMANVAADADALPEEDVDAAAQIPSERVVVVDLRRVQRDVRADEPEAADGVRLDGPGGDSDDEIAHRREDVALGARRGGKEVFRVGDV